MGGLEKGGIVGGELTGRAADPRWEPWTAAALGAVWFAAAAFGAVEPWSRAAVQLSLFLLAGLWTLRTWAHPGGWRPPPALLLWAVPPAWGALQLLLGWTVYRAATWSALLHWLSCFLAALLAGRVFQCGEPRRRFVRAAAVAGVAFAAWGVGQRLLSPGRVYGISVAGAVPFSSFFNRNHYAAFAEIVLPAALYLCLMGRRGRERSGWAVVSGLIMASVLLAGSRAGTILIVIEALTVWWAVWRSRRASPGGVALVALAALAATLLVGGEVVAARFVEAEPLRHRKQIAASAVRMWAERPWTGFGLGTFETTYPAYATFDAARRVDHAHNDWVEWLAEGGAVPVAALVAVFGYSLRMALRRPWGIGAPAVLLHSLVDFPMQIPAVALGAAVTFGAISARTLSTFDSEGLVRS